MPNRLSADEIEAARAARPGWRVEAGRMCLSLTCRDFSEAFALMCRVAMLAEAQDHHPDWSNAYNKIEICLTTHSAGGLTQADLRLAEAIDRVRGG